MPSIFISYIRQDFQRINVIAEALEYAGFNVWLDRNKILPGQQWELLIRREINRCNYFLSCWSSRAAAKRGFFHAEYRYAQEVARRMPEDEIFVIPVRLNDCTLPFDLEQTTHIFNCFSDLEVQALIRSLQAITERYRTKSEPISPEQVLAYYKSLLGRQSITSVSTQINQAIRKGSDYPAILYLLAVILYLSSIDLTSQRAHTRLLQQLEPMLELALNFPFTSNTAKVVAACIAFDFYYSRALRSPYDYRLFLQEAFAKRHTVDRDLIKYLNYSNSFAKLLKPIIS
jgi:hypothetical protein